MTALLQEGKPYTLRCLLGSLDMPGIILPPFPDDIPTHPLLVVDFALIKAGNTQEIDKLWEAATGLGFWYLKNHGADREVEQMFEMGEETMDLPLEEKLKYTQGAQGNENAVGTFGYKAAGEYITDEKGSPDTVEYITIAKDDALKYPEVVHSTYPSTVNARMESTIKPFVLKALEVNNTIIATFENKLSLPAGALLKCHSLEEPSGSEGRTIKSSLRRDSTKDRIALGAHTDFGSLSFLHNRLGGLQVLPPGREGWQYVRPLPGHAICNIGDTLTLLSGGILHSNLHRVMPPPGAQAGLPRWSVVFFSRPGQSVRVRALADESEVIKDALDKMSTEERARYEPEATAGEWFARRVKYLRTKNMKGPENWQASRVKVLRMTIKQVVELSDTYERLQKRVEADPGLPVPNPSVPFWHDVLSPIASHDLKTLPEYVDVVIIGSGITGASAGHTFFRKGGHELTVLMLEARDACSGATGRNGGHVKPPLYHDYLDLKKKFGAEQAAKLIRFRQMHIHELISTATEEDILEESQCREVDSLDVYLTRETFEEGKTQLQVWKEDMPEEAKDFVWVEGEEAIERFRLSSEVVGVIYNSAGAVHPYRFVTGILAGLLSKYPDRFYLSTNTPCTEILPSSNSNDLYTVVTPRGNVRTAHVVHATNAWCSHLLPPLRGKIFCMRANMTAQRPGAALSLSSLNGARSWAFYDNHIGYDYLTQLPGSERELMFGGGLGAVGEDGLDDIGSSDDSQLSRGIMEYLAGALPLLFGGKNWGSEADEDGDARWSQGRVKAMWSGIVSVSADHNPWVGRLPPKLTGRPTPIISALQKSANNTKLASPGEWIAAGYNGEGMAHAFLASRALALQILDRAPDAQAWFPECLDVNEKRWEEAHAEDLIEELLK
ncbi:hypothetical protein EW145_g1235 [Phellinidium pouzarii]|uniref:Fe2OG dioxygenase domain-containing protein n=1 Tax=Phellinidium pouzarii TaxID=167371 RepID=A0A4S4LFY5_9AGAM|nr:hypothetical protein EW145_g1235 [Phellinidium pouzarii]